MVPGLLYIPNFITEDEEKGLISNIDNMEWDSKLKRLTQHYGYRYDYTKRSVDSSMKLGDIPEFFTDIKTKVTEHFNKEPDQVIVNEYQPGQGIGRHVDCVPCFGPVVASLSLLAPCTMLLQTRGLPYDDPLCQTHHLWLEPRSLIVLNKDARYKWAHSIPMRYTDEHNDEIIYRERRVSVTFRTVIINGN